MKNKLESSSSQAVECISITMRPGAAQAWPQLVISVEGGS